MPRIVLKTQYRGIEFWVFEFYLHPGEFFAVSKTQPHLESRDYHTQIEAINDMKIQIDVQKGPVSLDLEEAA